MKIVLCTEPLPRGALAAPFTFVFFITCIAANFNDYDCSHQEPSVKKLSRQAKAKLRRRKKKLERQIQIKDSITVDESNSGEVLPNAIT